MRRLAGFLAIAMTLATVPAIGVSAEETAAAVKNVVYLQEDFSDKASAEANGWVIPEPFWVTEDGTLRYEGVSLTNQAYREWDEFELPLQNQPWVLCFKAKVDHAYTQVLFCFDSLRLKTYTIDASSAFGGAAPSENPWKEYMIYYNTSTDVDVYYRPVGTAAWTLLVNNAVTQSYWETDSFRVATSGVEGAKAEFDDILLYQGLGLKWAPTVIEGNTLTTGAEIYGTPGQSFSKDVTWIALDYDEENGYISTIDDEAKKLSSTDGWVNSGDVTLTLPGFTGAASEVTLLAWDSVESGVPAVNTTKSITPNTVDAEQEPEKNSAGEVVQETGITVTENLNEVILQGYIGKNDDASYMTASLTDESGKLCAATQVLPNKHGMIETALGVNPGTCVSGDYTLRIQYGDEAVQTSTVEIITDSPNLPYETITSEETFGTFIESYGSKAAKAILSKESGKEVLYRHYLAAKGEGTVDDFIDFRDIMKEAIAAYDFDASILAEINQKSANQDWYGIEIMLTQTYKDYLGIDKSLKSEVEDTKALFTRMFGTYTDVLEIPAAYVAAVAAQKEAEAEDTSGNDYQPTPSYTGGFGGGGVVSVKPSEDEEEPEDGETVPEDSEKPAVITSQEFTDLASVPWAEEGILGLQENGIVSGEGDGRFYPDRTITREEFLKMLMGAAAISAENVGNVGFSDMVPGAWYYDYVAAAYEKGIVKGISDTAFGIGQNITRADMAVMLYRTVAENLGLDIEATKAAFVYSDFDMIPNYAEESISVLSEAGLMNGMGENTFMPMANATRAEAAVAIYRIYNYIIERR